MSIWDWEQLTKRGSLYKLKNSVTVRPGSKFVGIWDIFTIVNPPSMFLMSSTGIESWGCKSVITHQIILREPAHYPGIKIIDGDAVPARLHPLDPELQLDDVFTRRGFNQKSEKHVNFRCENRAENPESVESATNL